MPRVSVLIPSYNHAAFLNECLDSIFRQTFTDLEVVLVDDGSKDESVALAEAYAKREPRLRVYRNEANLGTYGTEQRALELSTGEFVAVMNSDDLWHPSKLERQVALLDANPETSLCYVLGWMVDGEGKEIAGEDVHFDWPRDAVQEVLPFLLYENRVLASGVLFRRAGLRFETSCRYSGDWVALLERAREHPVACVPERLTYWRQHDNNTYLRSVNQMKEEIRVRRAIFAQESRWFSPRLNRALVKAGLGKNAMNLCALYVYFGDFAAARKMGFRAIRDSGGNPSAIKRTVCTFLPKERARSLIWREERNGFPSFSDLRPELAKIPPLEFR